MDFGFRAVSRKVRMIDWPANCCVMVGIARYIRFAAWCKGSLPSHQSTFEDGHQMRRSVATVP